MRKIKKDRGLSSQQHDLRELREDQLLVLVEEVAARPDDVHVDEVAVHSDEVLADEVAARLDEE